MKHTHRLHSDAEVRRQAKESLKRIRVLMARRPSPFEGLSTAEAIERIRAVREELWEQKFAPRS